MQNAFSLSAADFDGDGKLDLYVAFAGSSYCTPNYTSCFATLLGNGDGTFGAPGGPGGTLPSGTGYPAIGDFNGDGQLDVAVVAGKHVFGPFGGRIVGALRARQNFHERRFACAVFANEREHFARAKLERYVVQRADAGKRFPDAAHFEQRRVAVAL